MECELMKADKNCNEAGCGALPSSNGDEIEYCEEKDPMEEINEGSTLEETAIENDLKAAQTEQEESEYEGEIEELEDYDLEEEAPCVERTPTQVPKKRKDAAILAAAAEEVALKKEKGISIKAEPMETATNKTVKSEQEHPTSSILAAVKKDNSVDEEQCRVCTSKEDLVNIFKKMENLTVAEMLMTICPSVSIAKKDFMPQFICNPCLDNVTIAVQLKVQCENTERELRKKLSRSKNKLRRPTGYVVIDAPVESDPPSEEEPTDDVEFKMSDVEVSPSADDDSDDSDFSNSPKKRPTRGAGGRRGRRKSAVTTPSPKISVKKRTGRLPIKREAGDNDSSGPEPGEVRAPTRKKRNIAGPDKESVEKLTEYPCDECEQIFTRKLSLVLHKKVHGGGREPINCKICGKQFKIQGAYRTHLEKHKDNLPAHNCDKCESVFGTKSDLRRHLAEEHDEAGMVHECHQCRRIFVSETRLARHQDGRCHGYEGTKHKRIDLEGLAVGKDLFKAVAPLTTTYWSDSFSD